MLYGPWIVGFALFVFSILTFLFLVELGKKSDQLDVLEEKRKKRRAARQAKYATQKQDKAKKRADSLAFNSQYADAREALRHLPNATHNFRVYLHGENTYVYTNKCVLQNQIVSLNFMFFCLNLYTCLFVY